jgi:hypothetical protein
MKIDKRLALAVLAGYLLGVFWLVAVRFVMYKSDTVHYHANFALYINGQRDEFKNFTFYEEVQSCGSDEKNNPKTRVHMHDSVNHVAHVHEPGVTWGHFFANLDYALGDSLVKTDDGVFVDDQNGNKLTFTLNGKEVGGIANRHISSEDTLLINYGKDSADILKQRYDGITKDAAEFNRRNDPSSCSGNKELTFGERLKQAIGIQN